MKTKGAVTYKIDMDEVEKLASIGATQPEMAQWFGVSLSTIEKRLADPANRTILERGRAKMLMSIRRQQIAMLMAGSATMAIWLGKQYLGQRDKLDAGLSGELTVKRLIGVSLADLGVPEDEE